ncbi:hypothetical protein MXB_105 [Myxobolus squamalis]|nr:hypothetical protein MXB_105 [Myxobolus squamalis]
MLCHMRSSPNFPHILHWPTNPASTDIPNLLASNSLKISSDSSIKFNSDNSPEFIRYRVCVPPY